MAIFGLSLERRCLDGPFHLDVMRQYLTEVNILELSFVSITVFFRLWGQAIVVSTL